MLLLVLPIGALLNAIALLLLTKLSIPFSLLSTVLANLVLWLIFFISVKPYLKLKKLNMYPRSALGCIGIISIIILGCTFLYGGIHTLLPTFHYDSLTNWNIRSKVSYFRAELVFENHGGFIEKPYYPVLYHALQVTAMQFVPGWHDGVASGIHFLLSLSLILLCYKLLRERGYQSALVTMALLLGLPLMAMHTGQGYADLPLVLYAATSLLFFQRSDLLLSGILVTACVWTKAEGLFFCFVPWLLMVLWQARRISYAVIWTLVVSLLWPAFLLMNGYSLTPHGTSDTGIIFSLSAFSSYLSALFLSGSFGMFWYAVIPFFTVLVFQRRFSPTLLWGLLSFVGYSAVYLCTSNSEYLILGQSFDRQMLLPAALIIVSFSSLFSEDDTVVLR